MNAAAQGLYFLGNKQQMMQSLYDGHLTIPVTKELHARKQFIESNSSPTLVVVMVPVQLGVYTAYLLELKTE